MFILSSSEAAGQSCVLYLVCLPRHVGVAHVPTAREACEQCTRRAKGREHVFTDMLLAC